MMRQKRVSCPMLLAMNEYLDFMLFILPTLLLINPNIVVFRPKFHGYKILVALLLNISPSSPLTSYRSSFTTHCSPLTR